MFLNTLGRKALPMAMTLLAVTGGEATAQNSQPAVLPALTIQGTAPANSDTGEAYRVPRSSSATKTDTPLIDVPQTAIPVGKQVLEDVGGTTVESALDYVGGVAKGNNFGGLNLYEMNLRGLKTVNSAKNGFPANRRYDGTADAANTEQVDVLLGPSASLYGRGDPGGFVNIVTKKPFTENSTTVQGMTGSYDLFRGTLDSNFVLSDDKSLLGRANLAIESRDSFRDHVSSDRQFFSPVLSWQPNGETRLTLEAEALEDERTFDRGVVAVNGKLGLVPITRFLGEPGDGRIRNDNYQASARLERDVSDDWTLRAGLLSKTGSMYGFATEPSSLNSTTGELSRRRSLRDYNWNSHTAQLEALGHIETGSVKHTLLAGLEYERARASEHFYRANVPGTINIYNPVYGQSSVTPAILTDLLDVSDTYAIYLQDQIELSERWQLQLGLRADWLEQDFEERVSRRSAPQSREGYSPRAGLTYKVTPDVALYGSVAKSFRPVMDSNTGFSTTADGKPFEPETGLGYEAGIKADLLDRRLSVTAALFHITKQNVLTTDPADSSRQIQTGEVQSRGLDINIAGSLTPEWRIITGYAFIDAEVTKDSTIPAGASLQNIPRHSLALWNVYEFHSGPMKGLGFGGGVTAMDARSGSGSGDNFTLPGFAKVDLLGFYKLTETAKVSLNIYNLFDTEYYERGFGPLRVVPGTPLSAIAALSVTF
ncbi:MAG: TonB-dependent siderophore receptor [Ferrovibrio sp.]|uniref:TonB-dependent siderophore receptor n=1 Tax=Ferrovibrio sp. TaxID=1917215 RepID=UPI00262820E1|nr:TonB-dependent siderophore receptor [Ferrovibrio sp.]MCW0235642.1 TonB-dependent siderophore receptor [Ferrovibrio sp.]